MPARVGRRTPPGGGVLRLRRPLGPLLVLLVCIAATFATPGLARATTSVVARATIARVPVFRSTASRQPFRILDNPIADGAPLVFLVRRRIPGWVQVRLPIRPNGSLGWVRAGSVALALDSFKVAISLGNHRITAWQGRRVIAREAVAVGQASLPTPTGVYYIAELLEQPDPQGPYGPYAFGLSAYSNVLHSFGGGPGQIGIHGTNEPGLLGTSASHGCIRVSNALIARLARILPLGTPVAITR